jgi:hypothetical protein
MSAHLSTRCRGTTSSLSPYVISTGVPAPASAAGGALLPLLPPLLPCCSKVSSNSPAETATTLQASTHQPRCAIVRASACAHASINQLHL